jgi:2-keto-4-pentenoate hydratase
LETLTDIVAHCMFHDSCVVGDWVAVPDDGRVAIARRVRLIAAGRESKPEREDLVPQDVGELVLLVARVLAEFGERLHAGDLLLSGAYIERAMPVGAGATVVAELGSVGVVRCSVAP